MKYWEKILVVDLESKLGSAKPISADPLVTKGTASIAFGQIIYIFFAESHSTT